MARFYLRLSDDEFFSLTPRQFWALTQRKKEENERAELLMGIQTSVLANHSMSPPKKPYAPHDFMPSKQKEKVQKPKRFNRQKFANEIRTVMKMLPADRVKFIPAAPKTED